MLLWIPNAQLLHLRRVFAPLDTLFAIELVTSSYCFRVLMQGFASAEATREQ